MNVSVVVISAALWVFVFRKIPSWKWFVKFRAVLPNLLDSLFTGWTDCAFCGGFWIAIVLRGVTSLHAFELPLETPILVSWYLDALGTGMGILFIVRILDALAAVTRLDPTD